MELRAPLVASKVTTLHASPLLYPIHIFILYMQILVLYLTKVLGLLFILAYLLACILTTLLVYLLVSRTKVIGVGGGGGNVVNRMIEVSETTHLPF